MTDYDAIAQEFDDSTYRDAETLKRLYWEWELSMQDIAKVFDVTPSTIHYWFDENDVSRRSKTENGLGLRTGNRGYEQWPYHDPKDGSQTNVTVHRLLAVAEYGYDAVVGNDVHHKNGIRWDNRPDNIEVLTREGHMSKHMTGEESHSSVLTEKEVKEIRNHHEASDMTLREIAEKYGVHKDTVWDVVNRKTWKHID